MRAVVSDYAAAVASVPGIGKKTAQRIVLDLKERFDLPALEVVGARPGALAQARSALENLGYSPAEVRAALNDVEVSDDDEVEQVVKSALKVLA
jgi:Holliday junction DNA helicase RuvA